MSDENCSGESLEPMTPPISVPDLPVATAWDVEYDRQITTSDETGTTVTFETCHTRITELPISLGGSGQPQAPYLIDEALKLANIYLDDNNTVTNGDASVHVETTISAITRVPTPLPGQTFDDVKPRHLIINNLGRALDSLGFNGNDPVNGGDTVEAMDVVNKHLKPWLQTR